MGFLAFWVLNFFPSTKLRKGFIKLEKDLQCEFGICHVWALILKV